jgi:predicted DNA-binding ribbon-helix-helix protein
LSEKPASPCSQRAPEEGLNPGPPQKRSITIAGHKTSVSLEAAFWNVLRRLAAEEGSSLATLIAKVDAGRGKANLSSALRVYALERAALLPPSDAATPAGPPD